MFSQCIRAPPLNDLPIGHPLVMCVKAMLFHATAPAINERERLSSSHFCVPDAAVLSDTLG